MKKILVIRYRFLGDTILTVPFLQKLREQEPDANITVLTGSISGQILENNPYIDNIIYYNANSGHQYDQSNIKLNLFQKFQNIYNYIQNLKSHKFDCVYILKRSLSSAILAWLACIPQRIGFNTEYRQIFLTKSIPFNLKQHEVLNFLGHLDIFDIKPTNQELFFPTSEEINTAKELLYNNNIDTIKSKTIIIHIPAAHPDKMMNLNIWKDLIIQLKEQNYRIIYSGSPQDQHYYKNLQEYCDLDLTRSGLTLRENITLYKYADLIITVDSGPMHLAASVNTKVIGLFGPTDTQRWHPWLTPDNYILLTSNDDLPCRPCNLKLTCDNQRHCLNNITAKQILTSVKKLLNH